MSIVATFTREKWEETGGWSAVEPWVDGVVLLWHEGDDEPLDEETVWGMYCGQLPPRTCAYRFYRREDDGPWWLEEEGDDHPLKRVMYTHGVTVTRCPSCQWGYDVDPEHQHCPTCGPVPDTPPSDADGRGDPVAQT